MHPSTELRAGEGHASVLVDEVMAALALSPTDTTLDATLGGAGHFAHMLAALGEGGVIVGIDADGEAVERAREAYALDRRPHRPSAHLVNDNFRNLARILERLGVGRINAALFDLGWSGYQLSSLKGFSFANAEEPLLMTYGLPAQAGVGGHTAAELVNSLREHELADILSRYGEERFARAIAHEIVERRAKERILTVGQLVEVVEHAVPAWYQERRIHPATKTFQALRIATNDEFGALEEGLEAALAALGEGGRLAVITFHSLEDRIVKRALKEAEAGGVGAASKKPIVASRTEVAKNPRARSAKLRVFTKASALGKAPALDEKASGPAYEYGHTDPLLSYV